jgi:hypothetical protein
MHSLYLTWAVLDQFIQPPLGISRGLLEVILVDCIFTLTKIYPNHRALFQYWMEELDYFKDEHNNYYNDDTDFFVFLQMKDQARIACPKNVVNVAFIIILVGSVNRFIGLRRTLIWWM